ncbi:MAG: hypothetical protein FD180_1391 [Planctomycetota bacterium]|nr:MAG: hypothetical protein FD180_1391 [Planctomycetota bacterium]
MIRCLAVTAALFMALALPVRADDADDTKAGIMTKLETTKISLDFKDTNLSEVIDFLHEVTGINFVLSKTVLEKARGGELKVDIKLEDLPLRTALKLLLELNDLALVYRKGVLMVETKEERGSELDMKMYDVKDLLMKIRDFPGPSLELSSGEGDAGPTTGIVEPDEGAHPFDDPESLVNIIRNATGGDSTWGKDGVTIGISNGLLVVVQSASIHREIQELIVALRQFK